MLGLIGVNGHFGVLQRRPLRLSGAWLGPLDRTSLHLDSLTEEEIIIVSQVSRVQGLIHAFGLGLERALYSDLVSDLQLEFAFFLFLIQLFFELPSLLL